MKSWKKIALSGAAVLSVATLAACGSSASGSKTSTNTNPKDVKGNITLWVDTTQVSMYKPVVQQFEKEYPNVKVNLTQSPTGSSNAKTDVSKDPSKAADVFELPNDQLGQMANNGYTLPLTPDAQKTVKANSIQKAVDGVTTKGKDGQMNMYGYPFAEQAKILFYNKSKLSAEDVKSWDTLTAKGKVATTITDTQNGGQYTMVPMFLSNGVKLYGSNGEDLKGSTFNTKAAENVMTWIAKQKANPGVVDASTAAISDLQNGKADAYLDGPWDSVSIKKALGDNYAVATYPTADFGDGSKQMQSFVGIEAFAVNSQTKSQAAAQALAQYITNKDSQLTVWKQQGQIPVDKDAQKEAKTTPSEGSNAQVLDAVIKQVNFSTIMPSLPEMANMWNNVGPVIVGAYNGTIPASQYQAKLSAFNDSLSKSAQ